MNETVDACGIVRSHVIDHRLHGVAFTVVTGVAVD